jgi:hypothetical protein
VRFTFTQNLAGRKLRGRCVAQTSKNLGKPACTHTVTVGAFSFTAGVGAHKVRFQGRISKHNKLKPGRLSPSETYCSDRKREAAASPLRRLGPRTGR